MDRIRNTRMPWIIVLFLVALVCGLSWLVAYLIHDALAPADFGSYEAISGAADATIAVAGDGFVSYDGSTLTHMDSSGKVKWTYLIGGNVEFSAGKHGVAAWSGDMLTLIDMESGTATYSGAQDAGVVSARVGSDYAAVLLEPATDGSICVMETGGRQVYTAEFDQLTVIDYGFFSSGSLLWAMALDTTGSVPTCEITTYKPGSMRIVGSISDTEQLMYNVTFQSTSVCCTGVTYYKVYDYTGTEDESRRRLVYGWYLVSADSTDDPIMALVPAGQSDGSVGMQDVRMLRSDLDQKVRMPFPCESIVARGNHVYGFSADGHVMVATAGRQKVDAYQMPFGIENVYGVTDDGVAVVSSNGTVYLISLGE
jgi:hypothetical protein